MRVVPYFVFVIIVGTATLPLFAAPQKTAKRSTETAPPPVRFSNPSTMAKPVSTYSQVVEVTGGKTVYIAGQVALDPSGNFVGKDDFRAQVDQVFKNLKLAVESAGGDMSSLVKTNYYVAESVDPAQMSAVREIRGGEETGEARIPGRGGSGCGGEGQVESFPTHRRKADRCVGHPRAESAKRKRGRRRPHHTKDPD
jgi:enamine deaminase RidA (YjgF/YER057c/UK114 family)